MGLGGVPRWGQDSSRDRDLGLARKSTWHQEGGPLDQGTQPLSDNGASHLVIPTQNACLETSDAPHPPGFQWESGGCPRCLTEGWETAKDSIKALLPGILKPAPSADQAPRDWLVIGERVEPGVCGEIHVTAATVWETRARLSRLPSGASVFPPVTWVRLWECPVQ